MAERILALGELLVEVMRPQPDQPLSHTGAFAGPFASGAPAIFAVAAARLGATVDFTGVLGADLFGQLLMDRLEAEGVGHDAVRVVAAPATGVAFVAYDTSGRRTFIFHASNAAPALLAPEDVAAIDFSEVAFLHISGSTLLLSETAHPACMLAVQRAVAAGARISFDPNVRPELDDGTFLERCQPVLAHAEVVLPGEAEVQLLTDQPDAVAGCRVLLAQGVPIVALKQGARGSTVFTREETVSVEPLSVTEVDPTGAGDAYSAAFVVALLEGWGPARAARLANVVGALSVRQLGPMEALPLWEEVEQYL